MCALPAATVASTTGPTRFQVVDPAHTALLVMDMQEGLTAQAYAALHFAHAVVDASR
jgi:hypothetical protein